MLDTSSPQVRAVLPLLYVAWADGVLTPSEADTIRTRIRTQDWIEESTREEICGALDPQSPPTATQYFQWVRALKEGAKETSITTRCSLAELGVAMATVGGDGALPEASRRALEDIEAALGIDGEEVVSDLLGERPEPEPPAKEAPFEVDAMTGLLAVEQADRKSVV